MRRWQRAHVEERCGKCGRAIASGAPMLVFTHRGRVADSSHHRYRWRLVQVRGVRRRTRAGGADDAMKGKPVPKGSACGCISASSGRRSRTSAS